MTSSPYALAYNAPVVPCLICGEPLAVQLARGRKSNKLFIMMRCTKDGRHFRAFINDQAYVRQVLDRLEGRTRTNPDDDGVDLSSPSSDRSGADLERARPDLERARRQGKHIGRPRVSDRRGFPGRFRAIWERITAGDLSRRQAARELGVGYATLKRLLDATNSTFGPEAA